MISDDPDTATERPFGGAVLTALSAATFVFLAMETSLASLVWAVSARLGMPEAVLVGLEAVLTFGLLVMAIWFFRRCLRSERDMAGTLL